MSNPWLEIPLADYEGHMGSPEVQQLRALSDLFAEALAFTQPASVAIAGIAGGNGLDRIATVTTRRIVGLDINPEYLEAVRNRYGDLPGLELLDVDLSATPAPTEPVDLLHAALFFEHAGFDQSLDNTLALIAPHGTCSIVLQLPGGISIGPSGFASLQNLKSTFKLVPPDHVKRELQTRGFVLTTEKQVAVPGEKAFWMGIFRRS